MAKGPVLCPSCRQADQVEQVSRLYIAGLSRAHASSDPPAQEMKLKIQGLTPEQLKALARRLKPPTGGKEAARPLHPDWVVAGFSLVVPFFFYGIYTSQPHNFYQFLALLTLAYGAYFWQRRKLIARYQAALDKRQAAAQRVKQGIEKWMKLYYCAREDGIFLPGFSELIPLDQLHWYLIDDR